MNSTQLFPEVIDGSTLGERVSSPIYLAIGIEGEMDADGTAQVNELHQISRPSDAQALFGVASSLTSLITYVLNRGAGPVWAIASASAAAPTLVQRQAAWQTMEAKREIRIRLTDSTTQADLVALGASCDNANKLNNKQFSFAGMAAGTTKANLIAAAGAINSKRVVLVGPAVYDENGTLQSGAYAAASVAARVAINNDPSDDLDTVTLPLTTGIEQDALGNPLFRRIVVGGVVQDDYEDLLQAGVSPLAPSEEFGGSGGAAVTHLRMTFTAEEGAWDALMTRIIMDQVFSMIRDYAIKFNGLRKGNTSTTRNQLASGIDSLLKANQSIVQQTDLGDGTKGYGVVVSASADQRQQIISYTGEVVRGTSTILVDGNLLIAA